MPHPRIKHLLDKYNGDKSKVVREMVGKGNADELTPAQLRAIGFGDTFVDNHSDRGGRGGRGPVLAAPGHSEDNIAQRDPRDRGGSTGGGTGGGRDGGSAPAPDPYQDMLEQMAADRAQSAFALMKQLLTQYGLESLSGRLQDLIQQGVTDQASLTLALQDTNEWRQRFVGNEKLRASGLPVLSVAEYLATERSYAQIMKNFGLPEGFYDDPADFGDFIGNGVGPAELQDRVQSYADLVNREDPAIKQQLLSMGMSEGDLLAFTMDAERANPLIQKKYKTALIGAAARRTGVVADNAYAAKLAGMGVTEQQAAQGYGTIAESLDDLDRLGEIYGIDYSQRDFESEVFEGNGEAARKRKRLASRERAAFSGSSGVTSGSLRESTAGQF